MNVKVIFSPNNVYEKAIKELKKGIDEIDFTPNFLFLFLTEGSWKDYKKYLELLKNHFSNVPMVGCIVEGYIVEDSIWTRGVAILIGKFDGEVKVFYRRGNNPEKICKELGNEIGKNWDAILVVFPLLYFSSKFEVLKAFITDRRYYWSYKRQKTIDSKKKVLKEYSKYFESKFIYPADKVLRVLSEALGRKIPIIGMNLLPLEAESGTPLILTNYEIVKRGITVVCFKGRVESNINVIFHEVFPERGNSYEETLGMLREYLSNVEVIETVKAGIALGEINGFKPVDFLKMKKRGFEEVDESKFIEKLEKGKLEMATPYMIGFISEETNGATFSGLYNYPLNLFPLASEVNNFYDEAIFFGEVFRGGIKKFAEIFEYKKLEGFDFFIIDQNSIMSFGGELHLLLGLIKKRSKSFFGILSSFPSAFIPEPNKKFLSEIYKGICFSATGTNALFEFKSSC